MPWSQDLIKTFFWGMLYQNIGASMEEVARLMALSFQTKSLFYMQLVSCHQVKREMSKASKEIFLNNTRICRFKDLLLSKRMLERGCRYLTKNWYVPARSGFQKLFSQQGVPILQGPAQTWSGRMRDKKEHPESSTRRYQGWWTKDSLQEGDSEATRWAIGCGHC